MLKYINPLLAAAALLLSGTAFAKAGSPSEMRGLDTCKRAIERAERHLWRVTYAPVYYLNETDEGRQYYINLTGWDDGDRVHMRSDCTTSRSGRKVIAMTTESGRYRGVISRVNVEVAGR